MTMAIELNLTNEQAVSIGCQKLLGYRKFRKAVLEGNKDAALHFASWNFATDQQLMDSASLELQEEIRETAAAGGEGGKP